MPTAPFAIGPACGIYEVLGSNAAYVRTAHQPRQPSGVSLGTYVRSESLENTDILGWTSASIPQNPRTRRPAALVTLLQYSRWYLPWLAITTIWCASAAGSRSSPSAPTPSSASQLAGRSSTGSKSELPNRRRTRPRWSQRWLIKSHKLTQRPAHFGAGRFCYAQIWRI